MSTPETNSSKPNDDATHQTSPDEAEAGCANKNDYQGNTPTSNIGKETIAADSLTSQKNRSDSDQTSRSPITSTSINSIDNPQSLPKVYVGVDEMPDVKEPSLPIIGFNLSSFVLFIISGFILFLVIFLFTKEFDASPRIQIPNEANISDSTYVRKIELVRILQEEKKSYRDFTLQISQMILLNLLLPVLTAILGYIFASNKNKD
jgi:hypothetical protein